jgi:sulfide:quinone oxidoreductase
MKHLVILGAGTAGTMMAQHMAHHLDPHNWRILLVDRDDEHHYQPGYLFAPFGLYDRADIIKPRRQFVPRGAELVLGEIEAVEPAQNRVRMQDGRTLPYDFLIIASGCQIAPQQTEGLAGAGWRKNIFDFYTLGGALALRDALAKFQGGRLVINITEMPIKCPVTPLEFAFLADWYFQQRGLRNKVEIVYATPLPGAFTKPRAAKELGDLLVRKNIRVEAEYAIGRVETDKNQIVSWDERAIPFDLLVSIPTNMGAAFVERSGLGDELNFIPTDKHTLRSKKHENIFVLGDATDLPSSKAGSVAHFQAEILTENLLAAIAGRPLEAKFDGHANCFVETGHGKALLIDFNYDTEPLPGVFPLPGLGPMKLLRETRLNHWGKLMFKWIYWNMLLKARPLPLIPVHMSMAGKQV